MVYTEQAKTVEIVQEGGEEVLKINYEGVTHVPSIEGNPLVMMDAIDKILENPSISRISFSQRRNYNYSYEQTQMLVEVANIYSYFVKSKKVTRLQNLGLPTDPPQILGQRFDALQYIMFTLLRNDPLGAYAELKRLIRKETINSKSLMTAEQKSSLSIYMRLLGEIFDQLDHTKIIEQAREYLAGYKVGDREIYKLLFRPSITPDFLYSKLIISPPLDGKQLDVYKTGPSTDVSIFDQKNDLKKLYLITPPEFKISEDKFEIIDLAKKVLEEHQPREDEFLDPHKLRRTFTNIGKDLLRELAEQKGLQLSVEEIQELAEILVRNTIGFGIIELLIADEKVQDLTINSPMGQVPIFLLHEDYRDCVTNIIPTTKDFESWATKFRLLSGRPLDEANPILDTEVTFPGARSRLSVIGKPLNPYGYGMSFRRHRDTPWTLPLFIKNGMISELSAGLLSFTIDGARSHLVAGTRSSGKTSLLGSLLLEIKRTHRILTIEDSVTGDSEILIKENNKIKRTTIGHIIDQEIQNNWKWYNLTDHEICGNPKSIEVLSMSKSGKIKFSKVSKFIRHLVNKKIYEVTTSTGRKIKATGDHSLFSLGEKGDIVEIKTNNLSIGSYIATPRKLENNNKKKKTINILNFPHKLARTYFSGGNLKEFLQNHKKEIKQLAKDHGYKNAQINKWFRLGLIPGKILSDLEALDISLTKLKGINWKFNHNSKWIPTEIELDVDLLTFIGLWIADGCYDKNSIIMSVSSKEEQDLVNKIANRFKFSTKIHSDNFSLMIHSGSLKYLLREILSLKGNAYTKRIPQWVFDLSLKQIGSVLKGLFSGDGHVSKKEIMMALSSRKLLDDVQTLLLQFGIILRIGKLRPDKTNNSTISTLRDWKLFKIHIGLLQEYKDNSLNLLCNKVSTHCTSDIIPLPLCLKEKMRNVSRKFNYRDYVLRNNNIGRNKLQDVCLIMGSDAELSSGLKILVNSDIYWDKIREIKILEAEEDYVYDLSVPENESFVANNIVAHNTLELPTEAMRKLGYNIQPLKVRSALVKGGSEVPADEGIRTSLRLGDSALIVGEIRSKEASALYEAMRIGASANVVAGTIHGDSPYGVYDRVVNDLEVPKTSFKATDLIVMAAPIRSASGLKQFRRTVSITEVRKNWEEDPLREGGFVDLMKYNAKTDKLEPTPDLINGDSEILKGIGGNVKEWVGNWDAIWDNIVLRGKLKQMLVDYSDRAKDPKMLEADFALHANDMFYRKTDEVVQEVGQMDSKMIKQKWEDWLRDAVSKRSRQRIL